MSRLKWPKRILCLSIRDWKYQDWIEITCFEVEMLCSGVEFTSEPTREHSRISSSNPECSVLGGLRLASGPTLVKLNKQEIILFENNNAQFSLRAKLCGYYWRSVSISCHKTRQETLLRRQLTNILRMTQIHTAITQSHTVMEYQLYKLWYQCLL